MNDSTITSEVSAPYAQALMSLAKDNNLTDQVGEESSRILELLGSSDELALFLSNPLVGSEAKKGVLSQITADQVSPFVANFLMLLVDRGRIGFLEGILRQYQALLRELNQTVLAEVTSAVELSDEQKEAIKQRVIQISQARQVDLSVQVDPSLLGGLIIKVGSQVIDASLRGQLRRIGMQLGAPA
ncbi:ATP synthase F1 subunit delta [Pseudanabaena sp. FACHB-2040]|uniref:ATP synthase F1 subunit delta n=1 Tax=Pseudanabaena sp. FACHB-2040 TaxID=2692859 RepID=UPI0016894E58|nr:F0F1 ATP synthase subunit delta [Cyanobacteria bacterium Co-bin8]MBD2260173.1 F0F1 ATP synthase subunit delta [Pseudanabaena sp. FACHB-2040]